MRAVYLRFVMEAPSGAGLRALLSLQPRGASRWEQGGGGQRGRGISSFSIWLVVLWLLFYPTDLQSVPGVQVKNP